jgi:hypothetical protein
MNKFKYYFILMIGVVSLFSCSKNNDTPEVTPPRDYAVQYVEDNIAIETYLKSYYIGVINHAGFQDDQDVTYTKIPDGGVQPSIWSYLNSTSFPKLMSREVKLHDITYKVYYLVLREGVGVSPSNVDGVFSAYKGTLLDGTIFDFSYNEQKLFNLDGLSTNGGLAVGVEGWKEIFPLFKSGTYKESSTNNGTLVYSDFGAGVMFLPSGLAYFSQSPSDKIPAYSPLIFSLKLYEIKRYDHDNDGIPSYQEDVNGDGYMRVLATGVVNPDDTDGDGIPNFLDVDDDGDGYGTKIEIKNPATGLSYPFADIPSCSGNTTDAARIKKHLDKTCH